ERAWPLSHIPLLIEAAEWREIAHGIEERAQLLELVAADIYGEGRLIASGDLPAAAVTGPEFLHPLHGVPPPGGKYLHLYAADIGRGPDGKWWVLGDRAQAPSGAGYALANRLVLARAFPDIYRDTNVERLAPFFDGFRLGLASQTQRSDPRICLLTPGPFNETYFEQAYLARYLGFLLAEGGDLTMRGGKVHIRTIAGLKRADVIWRRIDGDFADPLELNSSSQLGVPGLIYALREGGIVIANALGSGVLEAPAMMSFLPRLCRTLLGKELRLPNIATWWCGQKVARQTVLGRMGELAIAGAFGNPVPGFAGPQPLLGAALTGEEQQRLKAAINQRGADFIGQEVVHLSTAPIWQDGRLLPRPFVLRVYAARTPTGWAIMPGGFCRVSGRADARAVAMGEGAQSADVWVLADKPVAMISLLPTDETVRIRRIVGTLPSRAADYLFWLGRYLERSEATLRLIRCLASRAVETEGGTTPPRSAASKLMSLLGAWHAAPSLPGQRPTAFAAAALHSEEQYGSALSIVREARRAASFIRERLSVDTWRLIGDLYQDLTAGWRAALTETEIFERADAALQTIAAISGLAQENMNRGAGWRIFDSGRRIERGICTCRFARHFGSGEAPADDLDVLLDLVDSQITFRSRYLMGLALNPVRDMVVLDPFNPRSVAFQVERLGEHLETLPLLSDDGMLEAPRRLILKLDAEVATATAQSLDIRTILGFEQSLLALADAIGARYFLQGPHVAQAEESSALA
ncbi:MAG: circularly permuted type 2 ATP-grasp protein, partial [Methylocapsa sp.]|nr:circularly permuted type 2 ATP-grasp protein [Methylocapsa sp.]